MNFLRVHWIWGRNECHVEILKRMIGTRDFKSKTPKGIFPDGAKKSRKHKSIFRMSGAAI